MPDPDAEEIHPGEFTDETELALCIVESMTANRGNLDLDTAGVRMLHLAAGPSRRWMQPATRPPSTRRPTRWSSPSRSTKTVPPPGTSPHAESRSDSCMRSGRFDPARLRADAEAVVRLTHGGPAAFNAATAVAYAVRLAATGAPRETWARETAEFLGGGELAERLAELDRRLAMASTALNPMSSSGQGRVWTRSNRFRRPSPRR